MINFSLEKFRSSDATETCRVKNSDNVLTKSRKLETKSIWIIKLRSSFKFEKAKEPRLNFFLLFIYRSRCTCVLQLTCVHSLSYETHGRSGAPNGRGPGSLNLLNLPLLRHWTVIMWFAESKLQSDGGQRTQMSKTQCIVLQLQIARLSYRRSGSALVVG